MSDLADIVIRVDASQLNAAAGATNELRRSTLTLLGSVDRVASAQISHANAMRTLQTAVRTGIITQQEMARTTASLTQRLEAQGLTLNSLGQVVQRNTGIFRRFGSSGMQQVGYQVGDFAVQVQSGTNALVALGQQGTQLLGIFGPAGAIAGAFFAIGTALLNVYFQTQKFKQAADNLKTGISELRAEIKLLQSGASGIAEEFGKVTTGLERTVRLVATVTLAKALGDARTQLAALTKDIYTSTAPIMTSTLLDQRYQETQRYKRDLGMGGAQATQMADMELALARAKTDKERLGILNQMNTEIEKQVVSGAIISDEGLQYVQSIALAQQGLQTVVNLQEELSGTMSDTNEKYAQGMLVVQRAQAAIAREKATQEAEYWDKYASGIMAVQQAQYTAVREKTAQDKEARDINSQMIAVQLANQKVIRDNQDKQEQALIRAYEYYAKSRVEGEKLSKIDFEAGIKAAATAAQTLADNLGVSLSAAQGIMALGKGKAEHGAEIYDPRSPNYIKGAGTFAEISSGAHPVSTYGQPVKDKTGTGVGSGATKADPLAELQKQIALQEELNGKTEAEIKVRQALGEDFSKYSPTVIKGLEDQIQKQIELEDRLKGQQEIWDTVQSSMEDAFMGMVDGTKSAKDAFKQMAAAIIKELYNVLVVQRMVGSFNQSTGQGTGLMGLLVKGIGGAFGGGSGYVKGMAGRADGGPISAGVPYMVGERGPEMIIPKSSGTVLTNGQTKAALSGGGESYTVNNHISVTGSDSVMVRQEIAKMIPQISSATKAAMIDAKKRGGQMGAAFR